MQMVPAVPGKDESDQGPRRMKVLGLVEELCSERSLFSFCWSVQHIPVKHALWPLHHIASEFAALMEQARRGRFGRGDAQKGRNTVRFVWPCRRLAVATAPLTTPADSLRAHAAPHVCAGGGHG